MAYTPELSYESSCTLRRIAWALGLPMTEAIDRVFDHIPEIVDREKVCEGCKSHESSPRIFYLYPALSFSIAMQHPDPLRVSS